MIVAGFGFRAGATSASLHDAFGRVHGGGRATLLATLAAKAESPAFAEFARAAGLPVHPVAPQDAAAQVTLTDGAASQAAHGTGSVAEASALAAAGPGARLIGRRVISTDRMATCALARSASNGGTQ
ncbi:cobalamin biosynthesis protein [Roseovarius salis]|uniref:cobalamin biosynthesis protein n=1 Tax=Roseovarius salis TaxID=3376063 RepID=UPI0037CCC183